MFPSPFDAPVRLPVIDPGAFRGAELARPGTWVVAFLADWCPFCRAFYPPFAALDRRGFELARADLTSMDSGLWDRFRIEVVPTVLVFREGKVVYRADGRCGEGLGPRDLEEIARAAGSM